MTAQTTETDYLELFGEWWFIRSDGHIYQVKEIYTDSDSFFTEKVKLDVRGPFPTRQTAKDARYYDSVLSYWEHGLTVYAEHCDSCGKYAETIAGDWVGGGWHWKVTWCKRCGFVDSRKET